MEQYKDAIEEHEEGTIIPLNSEAQLKEQYEKLQLKYIKATEDGDEAAMAKIEEEMNHISEQLGLDEEKQAA